MRIVRRRIVFYVFLIASWGAVAAVTLFYARNFTGLGPIPERSAVARRMSGVDEGEFLRARFFFASNRRPDQLDGGEDGQGTILGDTITYGLFEARLSHQLPVAQWAWEDPQHLRWAGYDRRDPTRFYEELRESVARSSERSLLVLVWGWKDRFRSAAVKTAYTAFVLDIDAPVLLFDWPGNQGNTPAGYLASREMARRSGPDLGRVLAELIRQSGARNIWVLGSSLGCQTICDAMTWMVTQTDLADDEPELAHIVLAAPDVSQHEFDQRFASELRAISRFTTVYVSSNDQALLLSELINRGPRLGRRPVADAGGGSQVDEAIDLLDLKAAGCEQLSLIDATPINRTRNLHHFFTDSAEFFDDLYRVLMQPGSTVARRLYPLRGDDGASCFILWRD